MEKIHSNMVYSQYYRKSRGTEKRETPMEIRLAGKEDHLKCAELDKLVFGSDKRMEFLNLRIQRREIFVATREDSVVGFIAFGPYLIGCMFISLLITHPDHRRGGIARRLVEKISAHCVDGRLFSSTEEDNVISLKTHEALGFRRSGYIENLPQPTKEIILFKTVE